MAMFMGRIEKVLIEEEVEIEGRKYLIGHNERYLKLAIDKFGENNQANKINQLIRVRIIKSLTDEILLCQEQ